MKRIILVVCVVLLCSGNVSAERAKVDDIARDPYISALVVDAASGEVLFEDHAETVVYPASVLKIMDMLVILDQLEQGKVQLDHMVQVTKEAAQMGGSQVYLDPSEQFSVEDLLYALAVQSANDAAVALAIHVAGSTEGFVALMNKKAEELGMKDSKFYSVHGLPPAKGQKPDQTTARDLALLGRELARRPAIFEYTNTRERPFRDGKFIMRNHNHLLGMVNGCDGFKTGYFQAAGFSIVATAERDGVRLIAIVMGSKDRKIRDAKTTELLAKGFALVPPKPVAAAVVEKPEVTPEKMAAPTSAAPETAPPVEVKQETAGSSGGGGWGMFFGGMLVGIVLSGAVALFLSRQNAKKRASSRGYL
jgi:serine-type D-Ala-D-Ala carboxypeptidase (penicillin-binding protein 5/6)